jgi:hypothetical protein
MNTLQHIDAGRSHTIWRAHHLSPYSFETCILDAGRTTTYGKHSAWLSYSTKVTLTLLIPVSSKLAELVWCKLLYPLFCSARCLE